jgi:hypothetical protein
MRRFFLVPMAAILLASELPAQRGSRDGSGGEGRGRQGSRGTPTPSFSPPGRPNTSPVQEPATRPSLIPESRPNRESRGGNRPSRADRPDLGVGNRPPTGGNRPNVPNRPEIGGNNRPPTGGGNRRPGIAGGERPPTGGGNRPSLIPESRPNRPAGGGNRPSRPDRPDLGVGSRPPTGGNRPNIPDRPPIGGDNRPPTGGGNRPDRPGIGGSRPDRPGAGGNRPGLPDRPGIGGGNRPNRPNWPGIGSGRPPVTDGGSIFNRPNRPSNRPVRPRDRPIIINNRPININIIRPGSRPWFDYHFHPWHRGYWGWWQPAGWYLGGASAGWMLAPRGPTFVFNNPFFDQSTVVFNYSQPLPAPPADKVEDSFEAADSAVETFDLAREAFARGDPGAALDLVDSAIKELPTDATLHEFRGLCLFALKDYRRAAETLYAVLAAGPGWDWETMHALYADVATYTEQLRALEAYQRAHPTSPEASFVLAYHYLVLGHLDAGIKQLENVVKLLPESQLASELLAALKAGAKEEAPSPG